MIEYARSKFGDAGITWREADGARLPFAEHTFDAVVCQFGYMFFPDKVAGFREAARVLAPTGSLWFSVWNSLDENPSGRIPHQAMSVAFEVAPLSSTVCRLAITMNRSFERISGRLGSRRSRSSALNSKAKHRLPLAWRPALSEGLRCTTCSPSAVRTSTVSNSRWLEDWRTSAAHHL